MNHKSTNHHPTDAITKTLKIGHTLCSMLKSHTKSTEHGPIVLENMHYCNTNHIKTESDTQHIINIFTCSYYHGTNKFCFEAVEQQLRVSIHMGTAQILYNISLKSVK